MIDLGVGGYWYYKCNERMYVPNDANADRASKRIELCDDYHGYGYGSRWSVD